MGAKNSSSPRPLARLVVKHHNDVAATLDRLQRWACARVFNLFPAADESLSVYNGRRFRITSRYCQEHRRWSDVLFPPF